MNNSTEKISTWKDITEEELYIPDIHTTITRTTQTCGRCHERIGFMGPKRYLRDDYCPRCGAHMIDAERLDLETAYYPNQPIRTPADMPHPIETTNPNSSLVDIGLSKAWWHHSRDMQYAVKCGIPDTPETAQLFELRDKLLTFGGHNVCLPQSDEHTANILTRGQLWYGGNISRAEDDVYHNTEEAASLWLKYRNQGVTLCTGFALTADGLWARKAWIVGPSYRHNVVLNETYEYVAYFGYAMTEEEALIYA